MNIQKKKARLNHLKFSEELHKSGMTQERFAEQVGISARHIRKLKKNDINISVDLAYNISKQFDVPIEDLLIITEDEEM